MSFFTLTEVRQAAARASGITNFSYSPPSDSSFASAAENYFANQAFYGTTPTNFDIFLSHAYADRVIVAGLHSLLTADGFSVYVDWIHDRNRLDRTQVTAANADILRERMRQCRSLLYATTQNHSSSKWMPWECGYYDGYDSKKIGTAVQAGHVAILPVVELMHSAFVGQEYLALYPTARKGAHTPRNLHIHNQTYPSLSKHFDAWVANGHP